MDNRIGLSKLKLLAVISFVMVLIPCVFLGLWIYSFNSQSNHADRVAMFYQYFPDFLNGRYTLSLVSILFCFFGIIFSSIYWKKQSALLKSLSIVVFGAGGFIILLTLFSLMWLNLKLKYSVSLVSPFIACEIAGTQAAALIFCSTNLELN